MCRPGVLIYKVEADVDTGMGPVKVYDAHRDSGGCTRSPNVQAELSDAPFGVGETFRDPDGVSASRSRESTRRGRIGWR